MKHVPNALTVARIILAPLFLVLLFMGSFEARIGALVVFVVAALSDWADGRVARRYGVRSRLGTFLDPLADKVLVIGAFVALTLLLPDVVPWWAVAIIATRDLLITGLRLWAESRHQPLTTAPLAKTKTGLQLAFVITLLVFYALAKLPILNGVSELSDTLLHGPLMFVFLLVVVGLTAYTGFLYFWRREVSAP